MEHSHLITPSRRAVQRSQQAEGTRPAEQRTRSAEVSTEHGEHRTPNCEGEQGQQREKDRVQP